MKKLYVDNTNTVVLVCPSCEKSKVVDVSRYLMKAGSPILTYRFTCDNCDCGHQDCNECLQQNCSLSHVAKVQLERRRQARKETVMQGSFTAKAGKRRSIRLVDLCRKAARLRFSSGHGLQPGDKGVLGFQLEQGKPSLVQKDAQILRCTEQEAVAVFAESETFSPSDKAIGFYLLD